MVARGAGRRPWNTLNSEEFELVLNLFADYRELLREIRRTDHRDLRMALRNKQKLRGSTSTGSRLNESVPFMGQRIDLRAQVQIPRRCACPPLLRMALYNPS